MPKEFIKDEEKWNKAKEIVKKQYDIDESAGEKFYKLVMGVYKQARGTIHKKGKGTYYVHKREGKISKKKLTSKKTKAPKVRKELRIVPISDVGDLFFLEKAVKKDLPEKLEKSLEFIPLNAFSEIIFLEKSIPLEKKYPGGRWVTSKGKKIYIMKDGLIAPETDFRKYYQQDILGGKTRIDKHKGGYEEEIPKPYSEFKLKRMEVQKNYKDMMFSLLDGLEVDSYPTSIEDNWDLPQFTRSLAKKQIEEKLSERVDTETVNDYAISDLGEGSIAKNNMDGIINLMTSKGALSGDIAIRDLFNEIKYRHLHTRDKAIQTDQEYSKKEFLQQLSPEAKKYLIKTLRDKFVDDRVRQWASTSADHDEDAITMQVAAKDFFNLQDAKIDHINQTFIENARGLPEQQHQAYKEILQAQYEATQEWFEENGIEEIFVYRGMSLERWDFKSTTDIDTKKLDMLEDEEETEIISRMKVSLQPLSSFSISPEVAEDFADIDHDFSVVSIMKVPVSRVLSTSRTGFGCLSEGEVVVLGGSDLDTISVITQKEKYMKDAIKNAFHEFSDADTEKVKMLEQKALDAVEGKEFDRYLKEYVMEKYQFAEEDTDSTEFLNMLSQEYVDTFKFNRNLRKNKLLAINENLGKFSSVIEFGYVKQGHNKKWRYYRLPKYDDIDGSWGIIHFSGDKSEEEQVKEIEKQVEAEVKDRVYALAKIYVETKYGVEQGSKEFEKVFDEEYKEIKRNVGLLKKSLNIVTMGELIDKKGYNKNKKFKIIKLGGS